AVVSPCDTVRVEEAIRCEVGGGTQGSRRGAGSVRSRNGISPQADPTRGAPPWVARSGIRERRRLRRVCRRTLGPESSPRRGDRRIRALPRMRSPVAVAAFVPLLAASAVVARSGPGPAQAQEAGDGTTPGQHLFEQRCALCHSTNDRGGQGPGLGGV